MIRYNNPDVERTTYICENCGAEWADSEAVMIDEFGEETCMECGEGCVYMDLIRDLEYEEEIRIHPDFIDALEGSNLDTIPEDFWREDQEFDPDTW